MHETLPQNTHMHMHVHAHKTAAEGDKEEEESWGVVFLLTKLLAAPM